MGNAQSAPEKRDARRLSKPPKAQGLAFSRYGEIPTSPLPIQAPILEQTFGVDEIVLTPQRPQIDHFQKTSSQAHLSPPSIAPLIQDHEVEDEVPELRRSSTKEPIYKLKSPFSSSTNVAPPSQTNLSFDPKTIDLKTAVGILEELRKTASPEDLVALHRALLPVRPDPLSPSDASPSAAAVIRPKSLATPGVATRKVSQVAKIEGQDTLLGTGWKPEMLGTSPLSKLEVLRNSFTPKKKGNKQEPSSPIRAQTPGDLDYAHTGPLRLGSLVVTNGMPKSPGPSLAETVKQLVVQRSFEGKHNEEYFTADESTELEDSEDNHSESGYDINPQTKEIFDSDVVDTVPQSLENSQDDAGLATPRLRSGSPLKRELHIEHNESSEEESPVLASTENQVKKRLSTPAQADTVTLSALLRAVAENTDLRLSQELPPRFYHARNESTNSAESLASEYQKDLPDSPFSPDIAAEDSNNLMAFGPMDLDETFEFQPQIDETEKEVKPTTPMSHHLIPVTPMENHLIPAYFDDEITQKTALGSHPPNPTDILAKSSSLKSRPSQSNSDSGYSTGSARAPEVDSTRNSWNNRPKTAFVEAPGPEIDVPFQRTLMNETAELEERDDSLLKKSVSTMESRTETSPIVSLAHAQTMPTQPSKPELRSKSWRNSFMRLPLSRLRSSESVSAQSIKSGQSDKGENSGKEPKTQRKLVKKKRPTSTQVFSLDETLDQEIPRIPSGMLQRFDDRDADFRESTIVSPTELDERIKSQQPQEKRNNAEPLQRKSSGKFLSFGSSRPSPVTSASAPSISDGNALPIPVPRARNGQRRLSFKRLSRNVDKGPKLAERSLSPDDDDDGYPQREYATYGSVAQSLGSSPYELAQMVTRSSYHGPMPSTHGKPQFGRGPPPPNQNNTMQRSWNQPLPQQWASNQDQQQQRSRPSIFRGRHRPKSFHGRGAPPRRMEVLGEEEIEAELDAAEENPHGKSNANSMNLANGWSLEPPAQRFFVESEAHPLPQVGGPPSSTIVPPASTDWEFHERTWRERREGLAAVAVATASSGSSPPPPNRAPPPPPSHRLSLQSYNGTNDNHVPYPNHTGIPESLRAGSGGLPQSPSLGAQNNQHPPHHRQTLGAPPLVRRNSKSQPDLRGGAAKQHKSWQGYAEAERVSAKPVGGIVMARRRPGVMAK